MDRQWIKRIATGKSFQIAISCLSVSNLKILKIREITYNSMLQGEIPSFGFGEIQDLSPLQVL